MRRAELCRYLRTVRYVPARQIVHRVRLQLLKQSYRAMPGLTARVFRGRAGTVGGWPASFVPLDVMTEAVGRPTLSDNVRGRFELLHEVHDLGDPIDWQPDDASQLWRYHLHYFDWAWIAVADPSPRHVEAARQLYRSWHAANPVGRWDAWSPYVVALRAWTLCALAGGASVDPAFRRDLVADLARHARYLRANVEFDVGGNHLVKNLKALAGMAVFLDDRRLLRFATRHLERQLEVQVLDDGGHFERSPGYHAQVLGDLIDLRDLLDQAGQRPDLVARLGDVIERMRAWLATLVLPDGSLPQLNDSVPVPAVRLAMLEVPATPAGTSVLEPSGYISIRTRQGTAVVMDVGPPCPDELPAHAQADALTILLQADDRPVLVDGGTSTYAAGGRRQYERSTPAHNTVTVDGQDQTEVWGAFRAGRRHRVTIHNIREDAGSVSVTASHDGYRHLVGSPVHQRTITVDAGRVIVDDLVEAGSSVHDVVAYWHLGPGAVWDADRGIATIGSSQLHVDAPERAEVKWIAPGQEPLGLIGVAHNVTEPSACLVVRLHRAELPVELRTTIDLRRSSAVNR